MAPGGLRKSKVRRRNNQRNNNQTAAALREIRRKIAARKIQRAWRAKTSENVDPLSLNHYHTAYQYRKGKQQYDARGLMQHILRSYALGKSPTFPLTREPITYENEEAIYRAAGGPHYRKANNRKSQYDRLSSYGINDERMAIREGFAPIWIMNNVDGGERLVMLKPGMTVRRAKNIIAKTFNRKPESFYLERRPRGPRVPHRQTAESMRHPPRPEILRNDERVKSGKSTERWHMRKSYDHVYANPRELRYYY